jgi:hypothetical protein
MRFIGAIALSLCVMLAAGCAQQQPSTPDSTPGSTPASLLRSAGAGEDLTVGGVGLYVQPANFSVSIPVADGSAILWARFYWSGRSDTDAGDDTIVINGTEYTGTLLDKHQLLTGTPWVFFYELDASGIVVPGANNFTVSGFDLVGVRTDGIGLAVIYADAASSWEQVQVIQPNEFVYWGWDYAGLDRTQVHSFSFTPASGAREGNLTLFVTDCEATRSDELWWDAGTGAPPADLVGSGQVLSNQFFSNAGEEIDIYQKGGLAIPAGDDFFAYQLFSPEDGNGDSMGHLFAALRVSRTPDGALGCRVTGGGVNETGTWDGTYAKGKAGAGGAVNRYEFGGQAGAPTGSDPQPWGEWTHHQQRGPAGRFVFHAGTASAPEETEIDLIECSDEGWCEQARPAPAKQIDFEGVGTFRSIQDPPASLEDVVPGETFHWFEVHIEDLGEPGQGGQQHPAGPECPPDGSAGQVADCECPDFYGITIYKGVASGEEPNRVDVIYEVHGYIQGGNLQIHPSLD